MRVRSCNLAALLALGLALSGCAAPIGSAAGNAVGGVAWGAMKGGKLAWKGGSFAARTAGKTVVGAAKGVHEEFSSPERNGRVQTASAQGQRAALAD